MVGIILQISKLPTKFCYCSQGKFRKDSIELVSVTNHFKFEAPDGKQRTADALDAEGVQTLATHYPNNRANAFLNWFTYSDS